MAAYGRLQKKWSPSRTDVREVRCPACGAEWGEHCVRWDPRALKEVLRVSNHAERVNLWLGLKEKGQV